MPTAELVYNPVSGRVRAAPLAARAADVLRAAGWEINLSPSESAEEVTGLARQAADQGKDAFFIAGGDGTVMRAAEGLLNSNTALAALPAGTANVWAGELGLPVWNWFNPRAVEKAAQILAHGKVQSVDVGICAGKPFLLWTGAGLDGVMVEKMEGKRNGARRFAHLRYFIETIWNARKWDGLDLDLLVDGKPISGRYIVAVVSNIKSYAAGFFKLSPLACLDDGEMDLWLFPGSKPSHSLKLIFDGFRGVHTRGKDVIHIPFSSLSMAAKNPLILQLDGDPFICDSKIEINVQKNALRVLVPQSAPAQLFTQPPITARIGEEYD